MKRIPEAHSHKTIKSSGLKPVTRPFLMIREREFSNLFDNPITKQQKMSKYFDE